MIKLYLNGYNHGANTAFVDATPWFDQASDAELEALSAERYPDTVTTGPSYYIGPMVVQITEWMARVAKEPEAIHFFELCRRIGSKPQPEIPAHYVDKWLEQRDLARGAVDDLLNGNTERE